MQAAVRRGALKQGSVSENNSFDGSYSYAEGTVPNRDGLWSSKPFWRLDMNSIVLGELAGKQVLGSFDLEESKQGHTLDTLGHTAKYQSPSRGLVG